MKLLTFVDETTGNYHLGVLTKKGVLDISKILKRCRDVMANKEKARGFSSFYLEAVYRTEAYRRTRAWTGRAESGKDYLYRSEL